MSPESLAIKLRQARGVMSLAEAAELSEIPEERIRMYEEGLRRPYGKTLRRLADVYGVRVAELVGSGQVVRGRGRSPEVRRRRRRIATPLVDGAPIVVPIAVPLEVAEGQTVRLVIEFVVRRLGAETLEDEATADEEERAPARVEEPRTRDAVPEAARPASTGGMLALGGPDALRRPRALEDVPRQLRDPIVELKQAYRDFRHKKG